MYLLEGASLKWWFPDDGNLIPDQEWIDAGCGKGNPGMSKLPGPYGPKG